MPIPPMQLVHAGASVDECDVLAVPIAPDGDTAALRGPDRSQLVDLDLAGYLARATTGNGPVTGAVGDVVAVPRIADPGPVEVLLVGIGDGTPLAYRRAGATLARRVKGRSRLATAVAAQADDDQLRAFVEGLALASYTFTRRSTPPKAKPVGEVLIMRESPAEGRPAFDRALTTAQAVWLARDLANTPSNEKDPAWLAAQAAETAAAAGVDIRIWDEADLAAEGFGGVLAVGSGSARPPRLIMMSYEPSPVEPDLPHVVLVGKGITFDSGGLSIKPRESMVAMKADMAGGAAVIAALGAARELGIRARVTGLVAAAENLPSGSAYRPSDVIKQYGGTTVEVLNTDAEGRLVLADALAYADRNLDPDVLIDIATLTGAAALSLSRRVAAIYATDDDLADALTAAGAAGGDQLWRMPLAEDYREAIDSEIADIAHIARDLRSQAGSITAALFLREFVGKRRWAHLDIAGPGKVDAEEHEITKGGTGFGVRTLLRWLETV